MRKGLPTSLAIGLVTGLLSGLMGIGGGIIAVPAMVAYLGMSQHKAHGTSLAMMVLTATASALAYSSRGEIDLRLAAMLAVGMVTGVYVGARLMPRVPGRHLRRGFGLLILGVGVRMIVG